MTASPTATIQLALAPPAARCALTCRGNPIVASSMEARLSPATWRAGGPPNNGAPRMVNRTPTRAANAAIGRSTRLRRPRRHQSTPARVQPTGGMSVPTAATRVVLHRRTDFTSSVWHAAHRRLPRKAWSAAGSVKVPPRSQGIGSPAADTATSPTGELDDNGRPLLPLDVDLRAQPPGERE